MHRQRSREESVSDTSLGSFQTCLEPGPRGRYLASPASLCKQLFLRALHLRLAFCSVLLILFLTVQQRVLAKVPLTHHRKRKKKK